METTNNVYELRVKDRIRHHSSQATNERIDQQTASNILAYSKFNKKEILARIEKLNNEWDIDRAIMANFSIVGALALLRSIKHKRVLGLLGLQLSFLLYYATRGWCPPMSILRRLGFRTKAEIEVEKAALLKML